MPVDGLLFSLPLAFILLLALLLSLFLFRGPEKERPSNRLLGLIVAIIGIKALNILINGLLLKNSFYLYNYALAFLEGPLLLLYARSLLGIRFRPHRDWFHFIPFSIVGLIGLIPGQLLQLQASYWELAPLLYTAIYIGSAVSFSQLRVPMLKEIRSNVPAGQAQALQMVLYIWGMKVVLLASYVLLELSGFAQPAFWLSMVFLLFDVMILAGFAWMILKREEPAGPVSTDEEALAAMIVQRGAADADTIKKNAALFKQLDVLLQQDKLYLDPGLTLPLFSKLAGGTPEQVSLAINSVGGQSFFDYINGYRVFTAQELLADKNKDLSIREVMYAAGFHSTQTFETAFRKVAGMTPDQFTRKNR